MVRVLGIASPFKTREFGCPETSVNNAV